MKRILVVALALALAGPALAQNINRSLQGSQDPRGPVGLDSSNSAYFPGHINAFGQFTATTTQSNCGAGAAMVAGSTDVAGTVTARQPQTCTIQFGSPFNATPNCIAMTQSLAAANTSGSSLSIASISTTSFTMQNITSGSNTAYLCIGNQ